MEKSVAPGSEPLDPPYGNSENVHERRALTKLGDNSHLEKLPDIYVSNDKNYLKSWKQARRAYKRHRIGEFHSPKRTTLQRRSNQDYWRLLETDRELQKEYTDLTTALISLRVPPERDGEYLPPLVTLDALMDALGPVMDSLRYRLQSYEYEYARVVAGTDVFATPHHHIYVWINGKPSFEELEPVVESFVSNCSLAPDCGTGNQACEGALSLQDDPEITESGETAGIVYIAKQLPHLTAIDEMTDDLLDWGAVAHATSRQFIACSHMPRSDTG